VIRFTTSGADVEFDLTFDLLNVFGNDGFAIIYRMDASRNNACQWIAICVNSIG
jgi:hypothetical protein